MTAKNRRMFSLITFSLILLCDPKMNIIEILPDFLAFFILGSLIKKSEYTVPYLAEVKSGLYKLGFLSLSKIPAMFIMFANMSYGSDILPLFTLIYSVCELLLIIPLICNAFSALTHLGTRSEASSFISRVKVFGISVTPDTVRNITIAFVSVRAFINFIPETCLLNYTNDLLSMRLARIYPTLMVISLLTSLVLGILWFVTVNGYKKNIKRDPNLKCVEAWLDCMAKEREVDKSLAVRKMTRTLTLLAISSLFTLDISLREFKNVNILPHFIYYFLLVYIAFSLYSKKWQRILPLLFGSLASLAATLCHYVTVKFYNEFEPSDLLRNIKAAEAYSKIEIFSSVETVFATCLYVVMAIGFLSFLRQNTGVSPDSPSYAKQEREYHLGMFRRGALIFVFSSLISLGKCVNVFLNRHVQLIYSTDITIQPVATSVLPWFSTVIFALSVLLIFLSFYFLSSVKEDIRIKYSDATKQG